MRIAANALNRMGLTALDVLERSPRDFVGVAIQYILIEAGVQKRASSSKATENSFPQHAGDHEAGSPRDQPSRRKETCGQSTYNNIKVTG